MASEPATQKLVYAAGLLQEVRLASQQHEVNYSPDNEGLLLRLFGSIPDYRDEQMDKLWHKVLDSEPDRIYAYCHKRGVEVRDRDGKPVSAWRDIAVMLLADELGLLQRSGQNRSSDN